MDQMQSEGVCLPQNAENNEESSIIEPQLIDNQDLHPLENQSITAGDDSSTSQGIQNIDCNVYSTANHLIQESESLCEDLTLQKTIQDPEHANQEQNYNENAIVTESTEVAEPDHPIDAAATEASSNNFQQDGTPIIISQESTTEPPIQQCDFQMEERNQNQSNSIEQGSQMNDALEQKAIPKETFIDLDIPKPDFSSTDDDNVSIRPPPVSSDDDDGPSPVDLDTILKTASLDESCQEKILNQSNQRINAPEQFIPSSQLMMTKQALQEGNSFLRCILTKLKSINQFLQEKTSKFLP